MNYKNVKGLTIEINGETTGLEKSLKTVDKTSKDLQKELKGVNTLLKMDPKNVELLRQKELLLNKSIGETKKKLDALKTAQKQMKDKGIDENSEAYRDLQREISSTKNKLKSLENEQKDFIRQSSRVRKVGQAWKNAGGKIKAAGTAASEASALAAGALAGIAAVAYKAAQKADDINTDAKKYSLSTEEIQKLAFAEDLVDVSNEAMYKGMAKTTKLAAKNSSVFKKLKVKTKDANGEFRKGEDIFYDVIDALGEIKNETERNALANEIFGRSYQELNPLIDVGTDKIRELSKKMEEMGLIVDQETLDKANEFNDQIDLIKATVSQASLIMGASLAENFGPQLDHIAEKIADIANAFANLPKGTQELILGGLAIVAALGPVLMIVGQVAFGIGALIEILPVIGAAFVTAGGVVAGAVTTVASAFGALAAALLANPITWIILAIVALAAAFVILWKKCDAFRNFWIKLWEKIKAVVAEVVQFIKDNWGGSLPQFMKNVGSKIVHGLWAGIKSAAGWLKNQIAGFVSDVIGAFKSFFGIHSPSKLMADQVGKWLPAGMSEGITDNLGGLQAAVDTMSGTVINAPTITPMSMTDEISNAIGTGLAVSDSGASLPQMINVVVELGGAKVGEKIVNLYDYTKKATG